ncbi:response regulator [Ectothiorhodospira mobilis]|uniref:response regulator n=1 Tax=Ectothiorhodospira mobilis TaxID=195064 RepID=UPI0030B82923
MPDSAGPAPLMIDILLVDDHELVRTGVRGLLERHGEPAGIRVAGEAASGEEALELLPRLRPDVILMDLNMPGLGGLESTRRVLESDPRVKVIVLTVQDEGPYPRWLLDSGAAGYLTKGCPVEELIHAVTTAMRGDRHVSPRFHEQLDSQALPPGPLDRLSPRERQILLLLVQGLRQQEIAAELGVNVKTVSTYKARLREKLGCESDMDLLRLAMEQGITRSHSPVHP